LGQSQVFFMYSKQDQRAPEDSVPEYFVLGQTLSLLCIQDKRAPEDSALEHCMLGQPQVFYVQRTKGPSKTLPLNTVGWVNLKSLMYTRPKGPPRFYP
jgi:hypothetical protein